MRKRKKRHLLATERVLTSDQTKAKSSWHDNQTGNYGEVSVIGQSKQRAVTKVPVLKDRIESVPPIELIGEIYTTRKSVNVRTGPGTHYKKMPPSLVPGEQFDVIGKVIDSPNWLMIAKDGAGSGYVYASLVTPMDKISVAKNTQFDPQVASVQTETVSSCKTVNHKITYSDGSTENETVQMCQRSDGSWDIS